MRRALIIFVQSLGVEHPNTGKVRENYIGILQVMGRTEDEIRGELASLFEKI